MNIDFYFVDHINFHKRNFNNFLNYIEKNYSYYYNNSFPALKKMQGNYKLKNICNLKRFDYYQDVFSSLTFENYKSLSYKGYLIWDIVKAELKSFLIPEIYKLNKEFSFADEERDIEKRISVLYKENKEHCSLKELVVNTYCVAAFWIDYWAAEFNKRKPLNVCVFGGTSIFSKCATLIAQTRNLNVISFEGTFLKKFHYADNASGVITNNHRFADRSLWTRLENLTLMDDQEKWLENQMENKSNLNVVQPSAVNKNSIYRSYNINTNKKIVLLIGQVIHDYSLTQDLSTFNSSIEFYKKVIDIFQNENDYHLFVKLHPWEKSLRKEGITKSVLLNYINVNSYNNVTIDYDINLDSLIDISEIGITACSQAGIEMLYKGKRVVQVGNAFYGYKGWTIDVTHKELLEKSIGIALENPKLNSNELLEVKKYLFHLLYNHCFMRYEMDENFIKKFNKVAKTNSRSPLKLFNNKHMQKVEKAIRDPRKAYKIIKTKIRYNIDYFFTKITSKRVINMVMGDFTESKIFRDLLNRFKSNLDHKYKVIVTKDSIPNASIYQYWRPNKSSGDIKSPSIVTVHHDFLKDDESLSLRHFIDSYRSADLVVCLNYSQKEALAKYGVNNSVVIPHGYDTSFQIKRLYKSQIDDNSKLIIGFCSKRYGRLVKGEELLYQIIERVKGLPVKFLFIGEGRKQEYNFCLEKGVEAEVYEDADYSSFPELYSKMDLFLITSIAEGGPASLPDAMISGLPVISTPCGFVPDFISDGWNGYILNDVGEFLLKINEFIENPNKLKKMGNNAKETDNLYSWEEIISQYEEAYSKLIK